MANCWICNLRPATTGEHSLKLSDLKSQLGKPEPGKHFYGHSDLKRNEKIQGLKSRKIMPVDLCPECNGSLSQPYDRAWEHVSSSLRALDVPIRKGGVIRHNKIIRYRTKERMKYLHLYFVKFFGCRIVEGNIPIDLKQFSNSLLHGTPHPKLHLSFFFEDDPDLTEMVAMSNIHAVKENGNLVFAAQIYTVGHLNVQIMFAEPSYKCDGLIDSWNPILGRKFIVMRAS